MPLFKSSRRALEQYLSEVSDQDLQNLEVAIRDDRNTALIKVGLHSFWGGVGLVPTHGLSAIVAGIMSAWNGIKCFRRWSFLSRIREELSTRGIDIQHTRIADLLSPRNLWNVICGMVSFDIVEILGSLWYNGIPISAVRIPMADGIVEALVRRLEMASTLMVKAK